MFKQAILNALIKEMMICRRLYTKIPPDQLSFSPKEGTRTMLELMQYLTIIGIAMPRFWLQEKQAFGDFFKNVTKTAYALSADQLPKAMEEQIEETRQLFADINEDDLYKISVDYPWGGTAPLGEALLQTSLKWLAAYKLQLFFYIKLSTSQNLGTPDAWLLTELEGEKQESIA